MESLILEGTGVTPKVYFSAQERVMEIGGYSRPENSRDFYYPILQWIDDYKTWLLESEKIKDSKENISFKFKYIYFNSSSAKFIYDMILALSAMQEEGIPLKIYWYFDEDDDELREAGEELSDMANVPFNYVEVSRS